MSFGFNADDLINCYRQGVFPMAEHRDDPDLFLVDPEVRGVLPLRDFHIPRSLRKVIRADPFDIRVDTAFSRVMEACAESTPDRPSTWINTPILNLYSDLHHRGHAHSVECWQDGRLVGGLYGVSVGGAFFGESMFSRVTNASKIALVHLVARLLYGGYVLLDAQFTNPHLKQFGIEEVRRADFRGMLKHALKYYGDFNAYDLLPASDRSGSAAIQRITQTS